MRTPWLSPRAPCPEPEVGWDWPNLHPERPPAIQVQGLTKIFQTYKREPGLLGATKALLRRTYEQAVAADDITFEVAAGELVGFLGPNGAGKTTTLKMLAGLLHPTAGSASVLGFTPWERPVQYRRQFALLLGQKNQLWWDLPARDSLELNAKLYAIDRRQFEQTLGELAEMLDVQDKLQVMVRELSLGERMKMELIAALLHQPKVLYLDEPTIGLDVLAQKTVRSFLKAYNEAKGTTILLTSHYMADIEALCRRVIVVDHGRIAYDGPLDSIAEGLSDHKIVVVQSDRAQQLADLDWTPMGEVVETTPTEVRLKIKRDWVIPACKKLLSGTSVTDLSIQNVPIETIIGGMFSRQSQFRTQAAGPRPALSAGRVTKGQTASPESWLETSAQVRPAT